MLDTFAGCAGRLSALMQHQWLFADPAARETEARRADMVALLDAVMPVRVGREVLSRRTAARSAHTALLTRAAFNEDTADAAWARRRAEAEIQLCYDLVLR
ncbi:hypothetical protein [Aliiruegeria haliotis]|nr:hypothetical protein [Aliiruegeria haliotis]